MASETGVLYGETAAEDPDGGVVGEADACGLGDAAGLGKGLDDAEGLGSGLGDGETFFAPVGRAEADNSLLRADDAPRPPGSTSDFEFDLPL